MSESANVHRSIQRQLLRSLLLGFVGLGLLFGVSFYAYIHRLLTREFDEVLVERARAIASMVELEADGKRYEFPDAGLPEFQGGPNAQFFLIRHPDDSEFARSRSFKKGQSLAPPPEPMTRKPLYYNVTLPDGRGGRAVAMWFSPLVEKMTSRGIEPLYDPKEPEMKLILARDRRPLDRALMLVALGLVACEALMGSATLWLLRYQLRESLQPLNDVAKLAASVDATSLHQRFPVETMPRELQPICQRLNDLLARIAKAVESQKRFNADAAHELRTPVAEVRALAEVALRWPEDADATRKAFEEIVSVTQHMERLSSVLLQLSGADGRVSTREEPVDLSKVLTQAIDRRKDMIAAKHITLDVDVPPTQMVTSDATLLTAIVENLVGNAITYTPPGGSIVCTANDGNSFQIKNGPTNLSPQDLSTMSEPFWRKDASRTGGKLGLGLALTRAYLSTLHGSLELNLDASSRLAATVALHANDKP